MKYTNIVSIIVLILLVAVPNPGHATDRELIYLKQLQDVRIISGNGDEKLFLLIRKSSVELEKDWSPDLARELARVFNVLLNANQNYFLVELLNPVIEKRPRQFRPILDEALSDKNKKLYRDLVEMDENEARQGNG